MAVKDSTPCPNCGHCPTCGRANVAPYTYPYFVPYPWHGYYPNYQPAWINVGGGTYSSVSVTASAPLASSVYNTLSAS